MRIIDLLDNEDEMTCSELYDESEEETNQSCDLDFGF